MAEQQNNNELNISVDTGIGIAAAGVTAFFATIDGFWLKSHNFDLTKVQDTQFAWMTFFAAIAALFFIAAVGLLGSVLARKVGPLVGYISKVALGIWGIAITGAVGFLVWNFIKAAQ